MIGTKPLHIKFNTIKIYFIRAYDKTNCLVLFDLEKCNAIYDMIRYLIDLKRSITWAFLQFWKDQNHSDIDFPLEKNIDIACYNTQSASFSKDQNCYYYNISLEKC